MSDGAEAPGALSTSVALGEGQISVARVCSG